MITIVRHRTLLAFSALVLALTFGPGNVFADDPGESPDAPVLTETAGHASVP